MTIGQLQMNAFNEYTFLLIGFTLIGTPNEQQPALNPEKGSTSRDGKKRKRVSPEGGGVTNLQGQLIEIVEQNSRMMKTQFEAMNINCQLDRDQRKDHTESLIGVLSRLADALGRIADKL